MRSWAKILVGILAALLLLCILGGFFLVQSGTLDRAKEFGRGIMGISQNAKGIEALDRQFPFREPSDGAMPEERLLVFIEVRKATKPAADTYEEWIKANEGKGNGDFKEAQAAIRLTGDVMREFRKALEAGKMSPREYAWLDRKAKDALSQLRSGAPSETERDLLETLRKASENPRLTRAEKEELQAKVKEAEERFAENGEAPSPDTALCARHRKELEETALGEVSGQLVRGFANSPHGRHRPRGEKSQVPEDPPEKR